MSSDSYNTTEVFFWSEFGFIFAEFFLCVSHKPLTAQNIYRKNWTKNMYYIKKNNPNSSAQK